jgi:hypothetical protein
MLLAIVCPASVCAVAACDSGHRVSVRVSIVGPDSTETPVPGVVLTAAPFDRDSIFRALEQRAAAPRPHVAELDSLFAAYRGPFLALAAASAAASDPNDARVAAARRTLDSVRAANDVRMDSLRRLMTQWENSTYRDYDSIASARLRRSGGSVITDTTGADGWARIRVPPGRWWIYATSWDVGDPNRYWYWNVPVTGDTLRLTSRSGVLRPRY